MAGERRTEDRVVPAYGIEIHRAQPACVVEGASIIDVSSTGAAFYAGKMFIPNEIVTFACADREPVKAKVIGCERLLTGKVRVRCKITAGAFDLDSVAPSNDSSAA